VLPPGFLDDFVAEETRLVGGGEQPSPHPVGYWDSVLLLRDPLWSEEKKVKDQYEGR
jgi:hypothetical protein